MRISDWSSDVCSSDLALPFALNPERARETLYHFGFQRMPPAIAARHERQYVEPRHQSATAMRLQTELRRTLALRIERKTGEKLSVPDQLAILRVEHGGDAVAPELAVPARQMANGADIAQIGRAHV